MYIMLCRAHPLNHGGGGGFGTMRLILTEDVRVLHASLAPPPVISLYRPHFIIFNALSRPTC